MSPLTQATSEGFSSDQIIQYLLRRFPKYSKDIQKALGQGFSATQVLQYLNKGRKGINEVGGELTEHEKTRVSDIEKQRGLEKGIGKATVGLGTAALGAYGLKRAGQSIIPEILSNLPTNAPTPVGPSVGAQVSQQATQPVAEAMQPTNNVPVPSPVPQQAISLPEGIINKIEQLRSAGNELDAIEGYFRKFSPAESNRFEKETGKNFREAVQEHLSKSPKKKEEKSSVLLPDGQIGEIESINKGIAKVKVGENFRHKKLDELMESPKEAANAALELIKSFTPEHARSAHHALNTYDPTTRSAQFLFHNGEGYIVDDISPEEYERLSQELDAAKTTGETKIGAWATGAGSRGAAYQKIVKNLKKPYRKIMVGYNLFKEFQRLINEKEE